MATPGHGPDERSEHLAGNRPHEAAGPGSSAHRFRASCSWRGSTAAGYEHYRRDHDGATPPSAAALALTADPAFGGDPARQNPEQLVVLAASSCQLLSFLAAASRARIDVLAYDDAAEGVMPEHARPMWIAEIILRPTVRVAAGTDADRVRHLLEVAHRECFIANSLRSEIRLEPTVLVGEHDEGLAD